MPKTENLGLNLTDDESTTMRAWQKSLDGVGDGSETSPKSNMQIIDEAIGGLEKNKQALLTPGFGIAIDDDGTIRLALDNASEGAY